MAWLILLIGGLCEVGWLIFLKYSGGFHAAAALDRHSRFHGGQHRLPWRRGQVAPNEHRLCGVDGHQHRRLCRDGHLSFR